jgi:hypothetical protein
VSIQFTQDNTGTFLVASDKAGAVALSNWNSVQTGGDYAGGNGSAAPLVTSSGTGALLDSTGAPSNLKFTLTSYGYSATNTNNVSGNNGSMLLHGGAITRGPGSDAPEPVKLSLSGLNPDESYKIIVYTLGGPNELGLGSVSLAGGPTYYFQTGEGDGGGGQLTELQTGASTANDFANIALGTAIPNPQTLKSNYIEFDNVSGSGTATLTLTELGAWPFGAWAPAPGTNGNVTLGIAGVQIIDLGKKGQAPAATSTPPSPAASPADK